MKHYYCTILSREYLYKGLVLYNSLLMHDTDFLLFIFCMEEEVKNILLKYCPRNAYIIDISDLEAYDRELFYTKGARSVQEYSWTAKAPAMLYVFRNFEFVDNIIWLDGDTAFFSDPEPIYREWGGCSILLTEEKYSGPYEVKSRLYGKYQLGFMGFRKDNEGVSCLKWFRSKVLEWCFNRFEEGRWADQKYADHWPEMYGNVCVMKHKGVNVNPFILYRYASEQGMKPERRDGKLFIGDEEIILFHFYSLDLYGSGEFDLSRYGSYLSDSALEYLYMPYAKSVRAAADIIKAVSPELSGEKEIKGQLIRNYFNLAANEEGADAYLNFCTLTSMGYLPRCLALHKSLESCKKNTRLFVCCLDEKAYSVLKELRLGNVIPIDSRCMEDDVLRNIRENGTVGDYAFMIKSTFISFILKNNYNLKKIVYVDADIYLYSEADWFFDMLNISGMTLLRKKEKLHGGMLGFCRNPDLFRYLEVWKQDSRLLYRKRRGLDPGSREKLLNRRVFKQEGIKVIDHPATILEPEDRMSRELTVIGGAPYINGRRLTAIHFRDSANREDLMPGGSSTYFQLFQEYSKLLGQMEERVHGTESRRSLYGGGMTEGGGEAAAVFQAAFRGKNIVVTGGNGFIGSRMVKRLAAYGANIYAAVRSTSDLWRIEDEPGNVKILRLDVREAAEVMEGIRTAKPDYVFHMAAYGVDNRQSDHIEAARTNILGIMNILEAMKASGYGKLINTGTSMQYGNKSGAITEDSPYTPVNIYGSTKAAATIMAHQAARENGIDIVTLIPFGVFGESEGSHKFFPHVIISALKGIDIELTHCEHFRDYCYVENIIDGFLLAAMSRTCRNEIFNIGSGDAYQLKHFVELIINRIGCRSNIKYGAVEYRKNDLWNPRPDIGKISGMLGWKPGISLEDGIDMTIEWYRNNLGKYSVKGR